MSLYKIMQTPCVRMVVAKQTPDGSGGFITEWTEGEAFTAAISRNSSIEARIAEAAGTVSVFTVTTPRSVELKYHDVFKRLEDGAIFRVTSDNKEKKTPACSAMDYARAAAEAWRLTE